MKVLLIDNFDSFTFNLFQFIGSILEKKKDQSSVKVIRNNEWTLEEIANYKPTHIVISPGPGNPKDKEYFGVCGEVITELGKSIPLLGVCLGMQGICHYFGSTIKHAKTPMHGKISNLQHNAKGVFARLPQDVEIMRYHSLVVDPKTLAEDLEITAKVVDSEGCEEIMGVRHKKYPIEGIQFHPESFGTEGGLKMVENFLNQ